MIRAAGLILTILTVGLGSAMVSKIAGSEDASSTNPGPAKKRIFHLIYATRVTGLQPNTLAKIWIPVASSSSDQEVELLGKKLPPVINSSQGREMEYGNEMIYLEARADAQGEIPVQIEYRVTRKEVRAINGKGATEVPALIERFLQPDSLVPIDGKPLELLKDQQLPMDILESSRKLYDLVNQHMKYSKDKTGWGRGDSVWACENKSGNCSDFHSLFISLARSRKIPTKFEIGFSIPTREPSGPIKGYHCWAKFFVEGKGWIPVDISEANKDSSMIDYYFGSLTADRVAFSTGRDIKLVPVQAGKPLNFFIFPHVEVDGKPLTNDKITTQISFQSH